MSSEAFRRRQRRDPIRVRVLVEVCGLFLSMESFQPNRLNLFDKGIGLRESMIGDLRDPHCSSAELTSFEILHAGTTEDGF